MKRILTCLLAVVSYATYAQDPDVTGSSVIGTVAPAATPYLTGEQVSFTITAGSSSGDLTWPPPGNTPFSVFISTNNIVNLSVTLAPGFANYFSTPTIVSAGGNNFTIEMEQIAEIPEAEFTQFIITGYAIGPNGTTVGYQANGDPGGYANIGTDDPSFYGVISGTLPVTLLDFNIKAEGKVANLKWSTSEETGSDHFQIQYSLDAKTWVTKGMVTAAGDSKTVKNYTFSDPDVANGDNYYRLKTVDKDGTFAINKPKSVYFEGIEEKVLDLYPNPTIDKFSIRSSDWTKVRGVQIMNPGGREVYRSGEKPSADINVSHLPNGIYTVKVIYSNLTETVKRLAIQN